MVQIFIVNEKERTMLGQHLDDAATSMSGLGVPLELSVSGSKSQYDAYAL